MGVDTNTLGYSLKRKYKLLNHNRLKKTGIYYINIIYHTTDTKY